MNLNINIKKEEELGLAPKLSKILDAIEDEAVFSPEEIAQLVGRATKTVRRWCSEGRIKAYSWGGRYVVYGVDFKEFMRKSQNRNKHARALITE